MAATLRVLGTSLFTSVTKFMSFNNRCTGKYELTITLDAEQVADVENLGIKNPDGTDWSVPSSEYNGTTQYKMKFKSKYKIKSKDSVDRNKAPFVDAETGLIKEVPMGSEVAVFFAPTLYNAFSGNPAGVSMYLNGIQIINEGGGISFDTFEDEVQEVTSNDF